MRFFPSLFLTPSILAALFAGCATSKVEPPLPPPVEEAPVEAASNDSFLSNELDVDDFIDRFEGESREIAVQHAAILAALELEPDMDVADVGAGTGLFMAPLSASTEGTVYAIDISQGFVDHLNQRKRAEGLDNVQTVLCTEQSIELMPETVDLAFVCDVYHHFTYPQSSLWSIHQALRPGGRLVVIDFERIPGVSREWLLNHVRAGKEVFRAEIEEAGFTFVKEVEIEGLEENYFLVFEK